jgi:signal transduction histidine kinase
VATTAYYVAAEALANALKHADPRELRVDVSHDDGTLTVTVSDDGRGGAVVRSGSGLAGLCDRVAAVGGSLSLDSERGAGTRVEARLPCGS